jgi:hypothetical protein
MLALPYTKDFQLERSAMEETSFDIFRGVPSKSPVWLEAVRGLSLAEQRLEQIAEKEPGAYFLFSLQAHRVFTQIDTGRYSSLKEPVAVDSFCCQ